MNENKLTKLIVVVMFLVFYACLPDQDIVDEGNKRQIEPLTTVNAQAWYEKNFGALPRLKSSSESEPPALLPDWRFSELYADSLWYAVESPLIAEEGTGVTLMSMDVSQYVDKKGDKSLALQVLRLVVLRNKESGQTYSFMMAVIPDLDYMLKYGHTIEENKYLDRQSDFSGLVYFYTVDGQFINGWLYENEERSKETKVAVVVPVEYCWFQDAYVGDVYKDRRLVCEIVYETIHVIREPGPGGDGMRNDGGVHIPTDRGNLGGATIDKEEPKRPRKEPRDPCENMKNKMSDFNFNRMLFNLSRLTTADYESGRSYTYQDGNYSFTDRNGAPGSPEIKYAPTSTSKIDGFIHVHYDGLLRTFSPSDLVIPYNWSVNTNGINDLSTFTVGLVTSEGTYFLFINNVDKYKAFGKKYGSAFGELKLGNWYDEEGLDESLNDKMAMKLLLKFMEKFETGLTLMKDGGDGKYEIVSRTWAGTVKYVKCN